MRAQSQLGIKLTARFPENVEVRLELARALKNMGAILRQQDDFEGSKPLMDQALSIRQAIADEYPEELEYRYRVALAHSSLADWYISRSNFSEALKHANQQLAIVQVLVERDLDDLDYQLRLPNAMNRLSDVYRHFRSEPDWAENAIMWLRKAEVLQRVLVEKFPLFGDSRKSLVNTLVNQGDVARHDSRPKRAIEKYQEALEIIEAGLKNTGIDNFKAQHTRALVLRRMGGQYEVLGNHEKAIQSYTRGIEECKNLLTIRENHYVTLNLIQLYHQRGILFFSREELVAAADDFRTYLAAGGTRWDVKSHLARVNLWGPNAEQDWQSTFALTTDLVTERPSDYLINVLHAAALQANNKPQLAIQFCDKASALTNRNRAECFIRSMSLDQLGNARRSEKEFAAGEKFLASYQPTDPHDLSLREVQAMKKRAMKILQN